MTHDPATDGNLFVWVLRQAAERRAGATSQAQHRAAYEAQLARKFHELPGDAAARPPIVLHSSGCRPGSPGWAIDAEGNATFDARTHAPESVA